MKKESFKEFLDSDENFRRAQINELQKVKEAVTNYEFMLPSEKEKINKALNTTQNYFKTRQLL